MSDKCTECTGQEDATRKGKWNLGGPCHCGTEHYTAEEVVEVWMCAGLHYEVRVRIKCGLCRHIVYCTYMLSGLKMGAKKQYWGQRGGTVPQRAKNVAVPYAQVQEHYSKMWDGDCLSLVLHDCKKWAGEFYDSLK